MSESAASPDVVTQLVETMRALSGPHPGFRPVHAKGIVCSGTFRAAAGARAVSRAPHLQGQAVPTVLRFSNSNGDPNIHDGIPSARAIAVKVRVTRRQEGRHPGAPHRRVSRADTCGVSRFPERATTRPRYRQACTRCGPALSGESSCHPRLHRASDEETDSGQLWAGLLLLRSMLLNSPPRMAPADSAAIAGCPRPGKPISPLMMRASAARTSCARSWRGA